MESGVPLAPPAAADHGLSVRRRLLDERGNALPAGAAVHSGDLIQVELSISSDTALDNLVVEDLLPAGVEIENPRLNTSAAQAAERPDKDGSVFQDARVDMRDDRLVVMGRLNRPGTGTYVYTVRAITPGTFVLPPVRGECMYDIGINSISQSARLQVLPAGGRGLANVEAAPQ